MRKQVKMALRQELKVFALRSPHKFLGFMVSLRLDENEFQR